MATFIVTGSLAGYANPPTLQYQDDSGNWQSLPAGATVSASGFSFIHPTITVAGNHTVSVRDANSPNVVGTSGAFPVTAVLGPPPSQAPVPVGTVLQRPASQFLGFSHYAGVQNANSETVRTVNYYFTMMGTPYRFKYVPTRQDFIANVYWDSTGVFGRPSTNPPVGAAAWTAGFSDPVYGKIFQDNGILPIMNGYMKGRSDPASIWQDTLSGVNDWIYRGIAQNAKYAGLPKLYYRISVELNGGSMPDCVADAPSIDTWLACWRYIANLMHSENTSTFQVLTCWNMNYSGWNNPYLPDNAGSLDGRRFYPGDQYVDIHTFDIYNTLYPDNDFTNWNADGSWAGTFSPDAATWVQNPNNRKKFWNEPSAKYFAPNDIGNYSHLTDGLGGNLSYSADGLGGNGWGMNKAIAFAKLCKKPFGFDEVGSGYNPGGTYIVNDPIFPGYLFDSCARAMLQGVPISHVCIFSENASDSHAAIDLYNGTDHIMAPIWQYYFGSGGGVSGL